MSHKEIRGLAKTALMVASENGHTDVVRVLCDAGANKDAQCRNGTNAIMLASQNGHTDVVRVLCDAGADMNALDKEGCRQW